MKTHGIARVDEIDALPDGRYRYRPVRHHFGITSFGVTAWVGAAAGDPIINEYDEDSQPAVELCVVVSGRAIFEVESEQVEAGPRHPHLHSAGHAANGRRGRAGDYDPRLRRHAGRGIRRDRMGAVGTTQAAPRDPRRAVVQGANRRIAGRTPPPVARW